MIIWMIIIRIIHVMILQLTSKVYSVRPTSHLVQRILKYNAVETGVWNLSAAVVPPASREAIWEEQYGKSK